MLLQMPQVLFLAPMQGGLCPPVTPAPGSLMPSSGFCGHLHKHVHMHTKNVFGCCFVLFLRQGFSVALDPVLELAL